jgi:integrase
LAVCFSNELGLPGKHRRRTSRKETVGAVENLKLLRGELLALRWRDVDLDGAKLRVQRSLEQTKAGLRFKAPKTKHGRRTMLIGGVILCGFLTLLLTA